MKLTRSFLLSTLITPTLLWSSVTHSAAVKQEQLYGKWQCIHHFSEPNQNISIKVDYTIELMKNKTSVGKGDLFFTMGGLPPFAYKESDSSLWDLQGNLLTLQSTAIGFVNISHPELEQVLNLQQLFPKHIKETVEVVSVSAQQIKVASSSHGKAYTCDKM